MFFATSDFASQIREQGKSAIGNIDNRKLGHKVHESLHVSNYSSFDLSRANSFWWLIDAVNANARGLSKKIAIEIAVATRTTHI